MPKSVAGPDRPQSTKMKLNSVTTERIRPRPSARVLSTNIRRSSAMRWSGLSVPGSVSAMR